MNQNILKVRMLGCFSLEYKGKELVLDRNNVSKTTQLFQLLLLHTQDGGISKAALIDHQNYKVTSEGSPRKRAVFFRIFFEKTSKKRLTKELTKQPG